MGFFQELRRRKVIRVAVVYSITGWLLVQVASIAFPAFEMPNWTLRGFITVVLLGFPIALIITWAFELTPDGVRPTQPVEEGGSQVVAPGRSRLDYVIMGLVVVAVGWLLYRTEIAPSKAPDVVAAQETGVLANSVAVLPFDNLSPNPDDAYFAAGVHEEILNQLAKIRDLAVIARTSVLRYAETDLSIQDIAAELNVGTVIEGSVRYAGERVRITAQLIDARTGAHLWSETYDRELTDIFAIESDIAANITDAMKVQFSVAEQQRIGGTPTENFEAYSRYLKASALLGQELNFQPVLAELDAAITLDPNYAQAIAMRAYVTAAQNIAINADSAPLTATEERENNELAKQLARRALAIDPNQGRAYTALAYAAQVDHEWDRQVEHGRRAYELSPNDPLVSFEYGRLLLAHGRGDEGLPLFDRAKALDPRNFLIAFFAAGELANAEYWEEAKQWSRIFIRELPQSDLGHTQLALWSVLSGDVETAESEAALAEALIDFEAIAAAPTRVDLLRLDGLTQAYSLMGKMDDAHRVYAYVARTVEKLPVTDDEKFRRYYGIGDYEKAAEHMARVIENDFPASAVFFFRFYSKNPVFDPLRKYPRFQEALRAVGQPDHWAN